MTPPMVGSWQVRIVAARPYAIHGDHYFEFAIAQLNAPANAPPEAVLRAPVHAFAVPPEENQAVEITFLMGQVTAVKPLVD